MGTNNTLDEGDSTNSCDIEQTHIDSPSVDQPHTPNQPSQSNGSSFSSIIPKSWINHSSVRNNMATRHQPANSPAISPKNIERDRLSSDEQFIKTVNKIVDFYNAIRVNQPQDTNRWLWQQIFTQLHTIQSLGDFNLIGNDGSANRLAMDQVVDWFREVFLESDNYIAKFKALLMAMANYYLYHTFEPLRDYLISFNEQKKLFSHLIQFVNFKDKVTYNQLIDMWLCRFPNMFFAGEGLSQCLQANTELNPMVEGSSSLNQVTAGRYANVINLTSFFYCPYHDLRHVNLQLWMEQVNQVAAKHRNHLYVISQMLDKLLTQIPLTLHQIDELLSDSALTQAITAFRDNKIDKYKQHDLVCKLFQAFENPEFCEAINNATENDCRSEEIYNIVDSYYKQLTDWQDQQLDLEEYLQRKQTELLDYLLKENCQTLIIGARQQLQQWPELSVSWLYNQSYEAQKLQKLVQDYSKDIIARLTDEVALPFKHESINTPNNVDPFDWHEAVLSHFLYKQINNALNHYAPSLNAQCIQLMQKMIVHFQTIESKHANSTLLPYLDHYMQRFEVFWKGSTSSDQITVSSQAIMSEQSLKKHYPYYSAILSAGSYLVEAEGLTQKIQTGQSPNYQKGMVNLVRAMFLNSLQTINQARLIKHATTTQRHYARLQNEQANYASLISCRQLRDKDASLYMLDIWEVALRQNFIQNARLAPSSSLFARLNQLYCHLSLNQYEDHGVVYNQLVDQVNDKLVELNTYTGGDVPKIGLDSIFNEKSQTMTHTSDNDKRPVQ